MISIEAEKDIIVQLAFMPEVDYIELYDHFVGKPIEVMKIKSSESKSIGGIEPGLAAINAPELWKLGYTGKARKLYNIDTGVWKDHPALTDAWLGNYLPIHQAWHAIDSPVPVDKDGSHGTHTAGTVLGLEQATNDTIGVAFNAYFMVADPIVTNLNDIKPLPAYIDVFQFALNPDGDTSTTSDIPDVINNSWGIAEHHDTSICAGYVTQMFDAIENAGIANVFSAGNEGSGDTTIGKPQYVSTGLVNTFTVGAVNANVSGNPIAGFSSRGPTACPSTGSLAIKPEVVAPGVNVRSSIDQNNYANYQGTSMAGPHASGAVLLLKEAFPNATGKEILLALYNSAIDLGIAGEDNTYGKGMIDVKAAFDSLSLVYTPTPQFSYDLTIQDITSPIQSFICNQTITPQFILQNKGDSTITNVNIEYQLNNEVINNSSWAGTLNSGDTTLITLAPISAALTGDYELRIRVWMDSTKTECDYINNQRFQRFNIRDVYASLPYKEDFENMRIDSSEWLIENPDFLRTWDTIPTGGLANSTHSAYVKLYQYGDLGQKDKLISTKIALPSFSLDSMFLKFDVAYQMIHPIKADSLSVYVSTDCNNSFDTIYKKGGTELQTLSTITQPFVPSDSSHWRTEYVNLTNYAGQEIIVTFESYNRNGNNLFIDNIWVYEGIEPTSIREDKQIKAFVAYPNPTTQTINFDFQNNDISNSNIEIVDILGKIIFQQPITKHQLNVNLSNFTNGLYFVKFSNQFGSKIQKVIKQ